MDMQMRSVETSRLLEICPGLENSLMCQFDDMLWTLMQTAAEKTHVSMEPWYSCLDPNLPGFQPLEDEEDDDRNLYEHYDDRNLYEHYGHKFVQAQKKSELRDQKLKDDGGLVSRLRSMFSVTTVDEKKAKGEHSSN